ncbi:MAG: zf-TFIIB domain-containing protein [Chloroflexota bacterium]
MKCPVCRIDSLEPCTLVDDLGAHRCRQCSGTWVPSLNYFAWLRRRDISSPDKAPGGERLPAWDTQQAKICPDCGHVLARYKVWPHVEFFIDHCGHCNGTWFDRNEWQVLEAHNLHDNLNEVFTGPWQRRLKEEEARQVLEVVYAARFGEADYARVRDVRAWLQSHPQSAMLLAYLSAKDPYKF